MSSDPFPSPTQAEPDALLTRLQDNYTRQKRLVAAQKRKQADIELQATAAYYSDLPVSLELLSDKTVCLFAELEHLIETTHKVPSTAGKEVALLRRIRAAVNQELRQSMSFIEEGYQSGFEKLMRQGQLEGPPSAMQTAATASTLQRPFTTTPSHVVASPTSSSETPSKKAQLSVREALSEHVSLVAESLAVLLQCETVRIYLYDDHANLRCAAQFPYHARHADPFQSNPLALMTVREVHQTVCRDRLAVNGAVDPLTAPSPSSSPPEKGRAENTPSGVEDVRTCLLFPLVASSGVVTSYGMISAVNKRCPGPVDGSGDTGGPGQPLRGFSVEDEVLVSNAARLLATALDRYPADAFTKTDIGEVIRRRAYPGDARVCSLSAHLPLILEDEMAEVVEVGQAALNRTLPTLVLRAPMKAVFSRAAGESQQRHLSTVGADHNASVSTVAFRLRCMDELWASSRDDNTTLHQQTRALAEAAQKTRLLLRNVLDGVATARAMRISAEVAQYLQTLEVYGRSERTERIAAFVADKMLTVSHDKEEAEETGSDVGNGHTAVSATKSNEDGTALSTHPTRDDGGGGGLSTVELRRLQHDHARLNTVTVASLHYDGPNGVPLYTSDPAQKREQVRFIDELRRTDVDTVPVSATAALRRNERGTNGGGGGRASSPQSSLPRLAVPVARATQKDTYSFQRPFKL